MSSTYIYDKSITDNGDVIESEKTTDIKPKKMVLITNGTGGCGKDTFAEILNNFVPVIKISSIDPVKTAAGHCGWDGTKNEKDRKFLSDLKIAMTEYNDAPFRYLSESYAWFKNSNFVVKNILIMDIREPEEIDRAKKAFEAKTLLIKNDRVAPITSNMADANVLNYDYDFVIENNGTLDEFEDTIRKWAEENVL